MDKCQEHAGICPLNYMLKSKIERVLSPQGLHLAATLPWWYKTVYE